MNRLIIAALAASSLLALSACNREAAATVAPIEGTWKADLASVQIEEEPDTYLLQDGQYSCSTCNPPLAVAADGQYHAVADRPYYDSMSVTVVDERTVKTARRKGDRDVGGATMTLSEDGNTLTIDWTDATTPNAPPVTGKATELRVAAGPAGSHGVSGQWKPGKVEQVSDEGMIVTFDVEGDTLKMSAPSGQSYTAKIGGPDVAVEGDTAGTVVAVTQPDANTIVETYKRGGKVVGVGTSKIGADGKMSGSYENRESGSTTRWTAAKQS